MSSNDVIDLRPQNAYCPAWLDDSDLDTYAIRIYLRLVRHVGNGTYTEASVPQLTEGTGMSVRRAQKALSDLEQRGLIYRHFRTATGQTTIYYILPHHGTDND